MSDALDFRQEALDCIGLAKAETHIEMKTILMGMALGWLKIAEGQGDNEFSLAPSIDPSAEETEVVAE